MVKSIILCPHRVFSRYFHNLRFEDLILLADFDCPKSRNISGFYGLLKKKITYGKRDYLW